MRRVITWGGGIMLLMLAAYLWMARSPSLPSRYILTAETILTLDPKQPEVEAVLVQGNQIAATGSLRSLQELHDVPVVHHAAVLTPGLVEPHTHPIAAALLGATLDISAFKYQTRDEIMQALKAAASKTAITPWIVAYGWDPVALPGLQPPTLAELDAIAPDRPMLILTQMLHDAYVNSAAIEVSGLDLPSHHLHETEAVNSVIATMPAASEAVAELLLRRQFSRYAAAGFTTLGVTGAVGRHRDPVGVLQRLSHEAGSPLRSFVYLLKDQIGDHALGGDADFAVVGAKFWLDGSPFTGGAATAQPYAKTQLVNEFLGIPAGKSAPVMVAEDTFIGQAKPLHQQGYQLALHVQGERAVARALDGIAALQADDPRPGLHHRLEHNALISAAQIDRAVALGVHLSFFVDHVSYYGHVLPFLFGQQRADRYMPVGAAMAAGASVSLHGDHPATPIAPLQTLRTAVSRLPLAQDVPVAPDQAISPQKALAAMTREAARHLGQEALLGTIEVGKQADFTIWSTDPRHPDNSDLAVRGTIKAGQPVDARMIVWAKPSLVLRAVWDMLGL